MLAESGSSTEIASGNRLSLGNDARSRAIDKVIIGLEKFAALEIEASEINQISQAAYRQKWRSRQD